LISRKVPYTFCTIQIVKIFLKISGNLVKKFLDKKEIKNTKDKTIATVQVYAFN